MNYLTIGTLWKNEYDYAIDFIKYHRGVGVEKFVIFDREYHKLHSMLSEYKDVEVVHFPEHIINNHQEAWGQLIEYNTGKTKWLALIDADQALVPVKTNDVREVLKNYEDFASLQCNWKAFGSSHHQNKEPGSVYERFLLCANPDSEYNFPTQFICQPERTLPVRTLEPHYPILPAGEISVNTNKEKIDDKKVVKMHPREPRIFNVPALHDILWVAHYTNKSKEEFLIKNNKGRADIPGAKIPMDQFEEYDAHCNSFKETRALELWNASNQQK